MRGFDLNRVTLFVDDSRRSPFDADYNNFSPPFGFGYAATNKTGFLTLQSGNPLKISQSGGVLWSNTQRPNVRPTRPSSAIRRPTTRRRTSARLPARRSCPRNVQLDFKYYF